MGLSHSPKIVTDGLVLCLDACNVKSYDKYENLVTYSQKFDDAIWNKNNCSVIQNDIISPDNTLTAARITATVNDDVIVDNYYTATYNATPLTYSIFAKAGTYRYIAIQSYVNVWSKTLVFDLQTGNPIEPFYPNDGRTWKIVSYPNGWYRCIVTYPANYYYYYRFRFALTNYVGPSDGGIDTTNSPSVGQYIYVWGAQLERGTTATDYYATTSSLKNRGTTSYDLSGKSNNGTLTNGPAFDNNNLGSFVFDGTDKYINGSLPTVGAGASVTIEAVIKLNDVTLGTTKDIINQGRSGITFSYGMIINGNNLRFRNSNSDHALSSPTALTTGVWYHLVLSSLGAVTTGYCNGISQGTAAVGVTTNSIADYHISRRSSTSASEFMNGNIALIRVYNNRAFTSAEVQQNFNALRGRFSL